MYKMQQFLAFWLSSLIRILSSPSSCSNQDLFHFEVPIASSLDKSAKTLLPVYCLMPTLYRSLISTVLYWKTFESFFSAETKWKRFAFRVPWVSRLLIFSTSNFDAAQYIESARQLILAPTSNNIIFADRLKRCSATLSDVCQYKPASILPPVRGCAMIENGMKRRPIFYPVSRQIKLNATMSSVNAPVWSTDFIHRWERQFPNEPL